MTADPATEADLAGFGSRFGGSFLDGLVLAVPSIPLELALKGTGSVISTAITILYYTLLVGGRGRTIGMGAMGLRVVDQGTGDPIGYPRGLIRWIGSVVSGLFFGLGYLWMLWDRKNQCWHDKLARDLVVRAE